MFPLWLIFVVAIMFSGCTPLCAHGGKMYVDFQEVDTRDDRFRIHTGGNAWIETSAMHRDVSGMYTFKENIIVNSASKRMEYEKRWKCPYCFQYWPMKTSCQNPDCPSKF